MYYVYILYFMNNMYLKHAIDGINAIYVQYLYTTFYYLFIYIYIYLK